MAKGCIQSIPRTVKYRCFPPKNLKLAKVSLQRVPGIGNVLARKFRKFGICNTFQLKKKFDKSKTGCGFELWLHHVVGANARHARHIHAAMAKLKGRRN